MTTIPEAEIEILKNYFNSESPLGPTVSSDNSDAASQALFKRYFDRDNLISRQLMRYPTMIVGRRGAGKTDTLVSCQADSRFNYYVHFKAGDVSRTFTTIMRNVEEMSRLKNISPLVEIVADLWDSLFWIALAATISHSHENKDAALNVSPELSVMQDFLSGASIDANLAHSPYQVLATSLRALRQAYNEALESIHGTQNSESFGEMLPLLRLGNYRIADLKRAAINFLNYGDEQAAILFDSVESIDVSAESFQLSVSGLMKCIGDFEGMGTNRVHIRCCIPAEAYFSLLNISSNALKDFQRSVILHWHPIELLRLAAKRFKVYLQCNYPDVEQYEHLIRIDLKERSEVLNFWAQILPEKVINRISQQEERTIPYILRHTQLLPRQILILMTSILNEMGPRPSISRGALTEELVVKGIREKEDTLASQAIKAYLFTWPDAERVINNVLPHLGSNIISYSELHKIVNQHAMLKQLGSERLSTYSDCIRMFTEIGVIGRLIKTTSEYAIAVFEYSEPNRVLLTEKDTICIHPIFCETYNVVVGGRTHGQYLPVYPMGTEPESQDRRITLQY